MPRRSSGFRLTPIWRFAPRLRNQSTRRRRGFLVSTETRGALFERSHYRGLICETVVSDLSWLKRHRRPAIIPRISRDSPSFDAHARAVLLSGSSPPANRSGTSVIAEHHQPETRSDREGRRRARRQRRKLGRETNGVHAISGPWPRGCFRMRENNAENVPDQRGRQRAVMQNATRTVLVLGRRRVGSAIHVNQLLRGASDPKKRSIRSANGGAGGETNENDLQ